MNIFMTGCSSGVGAVVRENLLKQGHRVYGVGLDGPDAKVDLRYFSPLEARKLLRTSFPDEVVHVLINNAGITNIDFMEKHEHLAFTEVLGVNLVAPFILTSEWFKLVHIQAHRWPTNCSAFRVIHTTSMATQIALRGSPGYCASKAGLEAFSAVCSKEWAGKYPILSLCVAPCTIDDTQMSGQVVEDLKRTRGMSEEEAQKYSRQSPFRRNATKDEVWKLFDFAVNSAPLMMSGSVLRMSAAMGV